MTAPQCEEWLYGARCKFVATAKLHWPGKRTRQLCARCLGRGEKIAAVLGIKASVEPLTEDADKGH